MLLILSTGWTVAYDNNNMFIIIIQLLLYYYIVCFVFKTVMLKLSNTINKAVENDPIYD